MFFNLSFQEYSRFQLQLRFIAQGEYNFFEGFIPIFIFSCKGALNIGFEISFALDALERLYNREIVGFGVSQDLR